LDLLVSDIHLCTLVILLDVLRDSLLKELSLVHQLTYKLFQLLVVCVPRPSFILINLLEKVFIIIQDLFAFQNVSLTILFDAFFGFSSSIIKILGDDSYRDNRFIFVLTQKLLGFRDFDRGFLQFHNRLIISTRRFRKGNSFFLVGMIWVENLI